MRTVISVGKAAQTCAGTVVDGAAGREPELSGGLQGTLRALPACVEHMADQGRGLMMDELLMFFEDGQHSLWPWPHHPALKSLSPAAKRCHRCALAAQSKTFAERDEAEALLQKTVALPQPGLPAESFRL
jgi:hypothetical protein